MGSNVSLPEPLFRAGSYGRESISVYQIEYPCKIELIYSEIIVPFKCDLSYGNCRVTSNSNPALMFQKTCESIGMKWYDAGKLMAMASYGKDNFDIDEDIMSLSSLWFDGNDLTNIKLKKKNKCVVMCYKIMENILDCPISNLQVHINTKGRS